MSNEQTPKPRARRQLRRSTTTRAALLIAIIGLTALAIERGWLTVAYIPLPRLNLAAPNAYLLDLQISRLGANRDQCNAILTPPYISAAAIDDQPNVADCGWRNAVKITSVAQAKLSVEQLSCATAAATTLWFAHVVQPQAQQKLGAQVASVQHFGTYACRNIQGNKLWRSHRSQHAQANAIDIAGFTLTDGRKISVLKHWSTTTPEADFLRAIHLGACKYYHVALGPNYNAAHRDHFHYDRGWFRSCR
ncbi:MAG: extensin family protein [Hyphomicrobiaceae bacterium]